MKKNFYSIVYDNPMPHLRSRQAMFPYLTKIKADKIMCSFVIGEAFESIDGTSYISESIDGGRTWSEPRRVFNSPISGRRTSDCCKIVKASEKELIGIGYYFYRDDTEKALGNEKTGGLLDDCVFITRSVDEGKSWSKPEPINNVWGSHTEASSPLCVLKNGYWVTPITGFPDWNGNMTSETCGRMLVSKDFGKTWNDDCICLNFENKNISCYEQRVCQLESGTVVVIGWNENLSTGELMNNHYALSYDNCKTFTQPIDTGIKGQASSICAIGGEKLFALHSLRKDTDRPGIYGYIVNLTDGKWNIEEEIIVWEPQTPILKTKNMAEIFSFLKFGQPSACLMDDGKLLVTFWFQENGQYKVAVSEIEI